MIRILLIFSAVAGFASVSGAGTFNFIGYGAANQAMANATVALPTDAFSQAYNPALMALQPKTEISLGLQGDMTSFTGINQVLIDTPDLGASANTFGDVSTTTESTFLATIAVQTPLYQGERPWHLGVNIVAPTDKVFEINTPDMFQPQYAMYLADTQRLVTGFAFAKELSDRFSVGIGGNVFLVQGASSRNRLPSGGNATSRLTTDIRAGVAPMAGLLYTINGYWNVGLTYRGKQDYQSQIDIDTQLNVLGPTDLIFSDLASVQYDPDMFLLGTSFGNDVNKVALAAKYEMWNPYQGGAIRMQFQTYQGSFSQYVPPFYFHDIISLHAGFQHKFAKNQLSAGYAFVPTPVPDQSGETNILDSDKNEVYLGWGWLWHPSFWEGDLKLDLVGFLDYLTPKHITKVSGQYIGAPGYDIGGVIYGYGATLTREF